MRPAEIRAIRAKLLPLFSEEEIALWMNLPHPQLDGRKPVDADYPLVKQIADKLERDR